MSELESDSHEEEFLMGSRQRRSNAGNRMKKLLEQEVEEMQSKTGSLNDDELDLLFKEDAEDEDFESGNSASEPEDSVEKEPVSQVEDEDLVVSESDEEVSDQDEDGEQELQRQEIAQRKRKRKAKPPVLKRKAVKVDRSAEEAKSKATYELLKAESLLTSDRRTSKRSHVIANKLEIYEKLNMAEKKRKIIQERLKKHKEQQNDAILTQEDRLRIAAETEKLNLLSLNKYKEQEISKKQTRLAMQQRQKMKFKTGEPIIQEVTTAWIVTPAMEVDDKAYWDEQLKKRDKRRKKYPRRQSKKQSPGPGKDGKSKNLQKDEPRAVSDNADETNHSTLPAMEKKEEEIVNASTMPNSAVKGDEKTTPNPLHHAKEQNLKDEMISDEERKKKEMTGPPTNKGDEQTPENKPTIDKSDDIGKEQKIEASLGIAAEQLPVTKVPEKGDTRSSTKQTFFKGETEINVDNLTDSQDKKKTGVPDSQEEMLDNVQPEDETKHVSFEEPRIKTMDPVDQDAKEQMQDQSNANDPEIPELMDDVESEEEQIYQGPSQEVSKNFVTIYNFAVDSCKGDVRDELFGLQWSGSNNQRSTDVENISKLVMPEVLPGADDKSPIVPDLSFLSSFPAFGEYGKKVIYDVGLNTGKELEIEIKTLPPSGVLFPNGVRKKCFITNKECQYFDPKNGVPYSDVEAYKVIQELQNPLGAGTNDEPIPHFQWFGFKNGGIYLNLEQRPAKGVPVGFA